MASMTVSKLAIAVASKAGEGAKAVPRPATVQLSAMESMAKKAAKLAMGVSAGVLLLSAAAAGDASAASVKVEMGKADGTLIFSPSSLSIAAGDTLQFINVGGFPHNIVFESGPDGVDVDALSHEDLINGPGDTVDITLSSPGVYEFYCEPHQGAGMTGKITVS